MHGSDAPLGPAASRWASSLIPCLSSPSHRARSHRYARGMISGTPSSLFEELGLYYIGPVDGHNMDDLVAILQGEARRQGH